MNGIFDENGVFKKYEFHRPLLSEIDSIIDNCKRDCYYKYYQTHKMTLEYKINFTSKRNNGLHNLQTINIAVDSYELNEKLKIARRNGFKFNQMNKLTMKFYSRQSDKTIRYYLKPRILLIHRQFHRKIAQNKEYIESFRNESSNPFQYACREWFYYNIPHYSYLNRIVIL